MFEDVRRSISHLREDRERARSRKLERDRRLSYIRTKRLGELESSEEGLKEQVGTELSAHHAATQALRERRQMERELRTARGPGVGMRTARSVGRIAKTTLYDIPVKTVRVAARLGRSGVLHKIVVGDTDFVLGKPRTPRRAVSLHEFMFGPPTLKSRDASNDTLRDILR